MADEETAGTSDDAGSVAALENALAGEQVTPVSAESATATQEETTTGKSPSQTVPYDRFKEVNDAKAAAVAEAEAFQTKLDAQTEAVARLSAMLENSQQDAATLQSIKDLAHNDNLRPHIEAVDRALRGIEDEPELPADASDEDKLKLTQDMLTKTKTNLEEQIANQRTDLIVQRADQMAERMLDQLPDAYTDKDREVISRIWADEVDWDQVEAQPESLGEVLNTTLQASLDLFGSPRGSLVSLDEYEVIDDENYKPVDPGPTPEEELKSLVEQDYGKIKLDDEGRPLGPEMSDAEFSAQMAKAMKAMNQR